MYNFALVNVSTDLPLIEIFTEVIDVCGESMRVLQSAKQTL